MRAGNGEQAMVTGGLFDLQVNGYAGVDFNDQSITAAALDQALEAMLADGVTGLLPTIISAVPGELRARFRALDAAVSVSRLGAAMIPGYHLEGPFLNAADGYRGCHPRAAMTDPDLGLVAELDAVLSRPILLVTLAPERAGGVEAVQGLVAAGKTVAIGHSAADYAEVGAAAQAGATLSTHLGNGLPQMMPKLENTLLAQLSEPRLAACLIADGHHMSPEALAALVALKGTANSLLVSDAVTAAAAPPGSYRFAGMEIVRDDQGAVANPDGAGLAGSALQLGQAVRNLVAWTDADPATAIEMASARPCAAIARSLGHYGLSIDLGRVEWNATLEPKIINRGSVAA